MNNNKFTRREITHLLQSAPRVIRNPGLDILLAPAQELPARLLVITSCKVGSAVERNLIRRRLKAIFHEQGLEEKKFDCVVIVKRPCAAFSFEKLKEIFLSAYTVF